MYRQFSYRYVVRAKLEYHQTYFIIHFLFTRVYENTRKIQYNTATFRYALTKYPCSGDSRNELFHYEDNNTVGIVGLNGECQLL